MKEWKPTILYVEDEEGIRLQLSRFLKNFCSTLFTASDGKEGLAEYEKHNPDLVISDIKMPRMDGIEMVKKIKGIDKNQPVIFTTAFSDSGFFMDAIDLGVDGYVLKPVDLEKLENKIEYISQQIRLNKEIEFQKTLVREIAQLQDNLLVVLDKAENVLFCNQHCLKFLQLKDADSFKSKYGSLDKLFLEKEDFFIPKNKNWIAQIQTLQESKRVVVMQNKESLKPHTFLVSVTITKETQHIIIVFTEITDIAIEKKEFERKAFRDELTGIYNRAYFNEALQKQMAFTKREKTPLGIIMFDIDKFKNINDTYGHQVGDVILQELTQIISKSIRAADTFARWGGEEFVRILPNSSLEQSIKIAENMRKTIQNHHFKDGIEVTCSFGVTTFLESDNADSLMKRADDALYKAKKNGRNRVEKGE